MSEHLRCLAPPFCQCGPKIYDRVSGTRRCTFGLCCLFGYRLTFCFLPLALKRLDIDGIVAAYFPRSSTEVNERQFAIVCADGKSKAPLLSALV